MKMADYRGMSDEQLSQTLSDTEKHLFQLRFQSATDRLETPSEIRKAKKELARIRTDQRRRDLKKLADLPAEQLATRIAALDAKETAGLPGKRTAHRQVRRLRTMFDAKLPTAKVGMVLSAAVVAKSISAPVTKEAK